MEEDWLSFNHNCEQKEVRKRVSWHHDACEGSSQESTLWQETKWESNTMQNMVDNDHVLSFSWSFHSPWNMQNETKTDPTHTVQQSATGFQDEQSLIHGQ